MKKIPLYLKMVQNTKDNGIRKLENAMVMAFILPPMGPSTKVISKMTWLTVVVVSSTFAAGYI